MSGDSAPPVLRLVVLAARAGSWVRTSLAAAQSLARLSRADLAALYFEDRTLMRIAEHPIAREVGAMSGIARPMAEHGIAEAHRMEGERLRRSLDELAWFEVTSGDFPARVATEVSESVAAVLAPRLPSPRFTRATAPGSGATLVLYDGSDAGDRAVDVAVRLASPADAMHVGVFADTPERFRELRTRAVARIPAEWHSTASALLPRPSPEAWARLSAAVRPTVAVIGFELPSKGHAAIASIVDRLACPLVVVG